MVKKEKQQREDLVTYECTINLRKRTHKITFKKKAPRAIREIKKFAMKQMGTKVVKIDSHLNQRLWKTGVRRIPGRIRVRISRLRNEDEDADEQLFSLVEYVDDQDFSNKRVTKVV